MLRTVFRNGVVRFKRSFSTATLPAPNTNPEILYTGVSYT
jgi:hypothetical protein